MTAAWMPSPAQALAALPDETPVFSAIGDCPVPKRVVQPARAIRGGEARRGSGGQHLADAAMMASPGDAQPAVICQRSSVCTY